MPGLLIVALVSVSAATHSPADSADSLNPVLVGGTYVDSSHVLLTFTGHSGINAEEGLLQWADTVGVWYSDTGVPSSRTGPSFKLSVEEMQEAGRYFSTTRTLTPLPPDPGSFYYFAATVFWHDPDTIPPLGTANAAQVLMIDTTSLPISLGLGSASYSRQDTTLTILVTNVHTIDDRAEFLGVWHGFDGPADFGASGSAEWVPVSQLTGSLYSHFITDPQFAGDTQMVYYAIALKGINNSLSTYITGSTQVGAPRPANPVVLTVDTLLTQGVALSWGPADSVRIWYGRNPVPKSAVVPPMEYVQINPPAGAAADTIRTLNEQTTYHFGLQVFTDGLWSAVTESSSVEADIPALPGGVGSVTNYLRLEQARVDSGQNEILVSLSLDTSSVIFSSDMQAGIAYAFETYPAWDTGLQVIELAGPDTAVTMRLKEQFRFNTSYYIGLWLRRYGSKWASPTDSSRAVLATGGLSRQAVTYLSGDDTVATALNDGIILRWSPVPQTNPGVEDTLRVYEPASLPAGLVSVGTAFSFSKALQSAPFEIGIRYDSIPSSANGLVHMFRDSAGLLIRAYDSYMADSAVRVRTNDLDLPFLALADTAPPVLRVQSDTAGVLAGDTSLKVEFSISDGVANTDICLEYGRAAFGFEKALRDTLLATSDTVEMTIPGGYAIAKLGGLRAAIVVNDGTHRDTVDISRRVSVSKNDAFQTEPGAWLPVRATAQLKDSSAETCLEGLKPSQEKWSYDPGRFRLFRWHPYKGNKSKTNKWIEYSDSLASLFAFVPGRVMWLKTRKQHAVAFGKGTTLPFGEPQAVVLNPGGWTDIAVPYKYPVMIGDVMEASGAIADSIQVFRWERSGNTYTPDDIYVPGIPSKSTGKDTLAHDLLSDAYCVYSFWPDPETLMIPPVPPALSKWPGMSKSRAAGPGWDIAVESFCDGRLNTVHCGVAPGKNDITFHPLRPRFAPVGVAVAEPGTGRLFGHAVAHDIEKGGAAFEIAFVNDAAREAEVTAHLALPDAFPDEFRAALYCPESGGFEKQAASYTVTVPARGRVSRWLAAGADAYLKAFSRDHLGYTLALRAVYPNPFFRRVLISYSLPNKHLDQVCFAVYDLQGREIWRKSIRDIHRPGFGVLSWDGRGPSGTPVAAGVYVLRMLVRESGSKKPLIFEKRLTRLP
ncbi:MAG: hypothetical protein GF410_08250 [Chitinivibrionales bacterium]|nr:hypothetical protein [Chitinivibrionales bacterium]